MAVELPEFATNGSNEIEPTESLKANGWGGGDQPPAQIFNWLGRTTYESVRLSLNLAQVGAATQHASTGCNIGGTRFVTAVAVDPSDGGHVIVGGGANATSRISHDGGKTWTTVPVLAGGANALAHVMVVQGQYAIGIDDTIGTATVCAYPYTSWGTGFATNFPPFTGSGPLSGCVTDLDNSAALVITGANRVYWIVGVPSSGADINEVNVSTVIQSLLGIATGNGINVICGDDGAGQGCIAYCPTTDGSSASDWTRVDLGSTASITDVCHDGARFIAVGDGGELFHSTDGVSWNPGLTVPGVTGDARLLADTQTGVVLMHDTAAGPYEDIWISRNGYSFAKVLSASDNVVSLDASARPRIAFLPERGWISGDTRGG